MGTAVDFATKELRSLIIRGAIPSDERITETSGAAVLGLSRTPLREALNRLEREGLLEKLDGRGYSIRQISLEDMKQAAQVRGVVEGLAAGELAQNGVTRPVARAIESSLAMSDEVIRKSELNEKDIDLYHEANTIFHQTIAEACGNSYVVSALEKVRQIPIVTPGAFTKLGEGQTNEKLRLTVGHSQHVIIWDAIQSGDRVRAENIMREHAHAPIRYAELFLGDDVEKVLAENLYDKSA